MSLKINVNSLNNTVIPKIKEGKNNLEKSSNIISKLEIPNDFSYKSELRGYISKIDDKKRMSNAIISTINSNIEVFKKIENTNKNILSNSMRKISQLSAKTNYASTGAKINEDATITLQTNGFDGEAAIAAILDFGNLINKGIKSTGAVVAEKFRMTYYNVLEPIFTAIGRTTASVVNVVISLLGGIANLAEHLFDAIVIISTAAASLGTGVYDFSQLISSKLSGLITGNKKDWQSVTKQMWNGTMTFTSTQYVNNFGKNFYENNIIGKYLDELSFSIFKSNGTVSNVANGIGEIIGIIGLIVLTAGVGGAAVGAGAGAGAGTGAAAGAAGTTSLSTIIGTAYAGLNAFGKFTTEKWEQAKEAYQNKVNEMYYKGEITAEELVKLKDQWTNLRTWASGMAYGGLNATWEALQWFIGGSLAQNPISQKIPKLLNSAINIFIDTSFNAGDTYVRAGTDALTTENKDFAIAFEERGGTSAVLTSIFIALICSTGGEVFNGMKNKQLNQIDEQKLRELLTKSDFNKTNLIDGIIKEIPDNVDDLTKMRIIYLKLNQALSYSDNYFAMSTIKDVYTSQLDEIYYKNFDISNLSTDSIVCSNWSQIYKDLLIEGGIDPSKVKIIQKGNERAHQYVLAEIRKWNDLLNGCYK